MSGVENAAPRHDGTRSSNPVRSSEEPCKPSVPRGRLSQSGTRSSNPASSSGESDANLTQVVTSTVRIPLSLIWSLKRCPTAERAPPVIGMSLAPAIPPGVRARV